jgi:hypothetical protein
MKPCPYRKNHEWDDKGMCIHCYAIREASGLRAPSMDVHPLAQLWCSIAGCDEPAIGLVRIDAARLASRCALHSPR